MKEKLKKIERFVSSIFSKLGLDHQYVVLNWISFCGFILGAIYSAIEVYLNINVTNYFVLLPIRLIGLFILWILFTIFYYIASFTLDELSKNVDISLLEIFSVAFTFIVVFIASVLIGCCIGIDGIILAMLLTVLNKIKTTNVFYKGG